MGKLFRFLTAALAVLCLAEIADLAWLSTSRATITSTATKIVGGGNTSTTQWNFSFVGVSAADLLVTYTNSSGVSQVLTLNSQYTVTFTPPTANAVWSIGGYVTYPLTGPPIGFGTTLTIQRMVPYTQVTPFQNQGQFLPQAVEIGLDLLTMQVQQLNTLFSGALVQPTTDAQPLTPLPAATQRANNALCFDSTGYNPIACATPASGIISSAMQPVVDAATLALGRTAFGLGSMATEGIGGGSCGGPSIADDGAGFARVVAPIAQDSTNQGVTCNFHLTQRIASGTLTYTLARASTTYFNGFVFTINSALGVTTVTPNAADNFAGVASGTSISIPQGTTCQVTTDAASSATWRMTCASSQPALAANASGNALTLTLYAPAIGFRDPTPSSGAAKWATPVGGLSVTIPTGATLGTLNTVAFRLWVIALYNGGTPVLAVLTCSTPGIVFACAAYETNVVGGTAITSGSTAAGVLYAASAVASSSARIIGYAEYASGLATAGTWASNPTTVQVCMPPFVCKRPGDVVQTATASTTSGGMTASATFAALSGGPTLGFALSSTANLVKASVVGSWSNSTGSNTTIGLQLVRGATVVGNPIGSTEGVGAGASPVFILGYDFPGVGGALSYVVQGKTAAGTLTYPASGTGSLIEIQEIMGALPKPANDNGSAALQMVG